MRLALHVANTGLQELHSEGHLGSWTWTGEKCFNRSFKKWAVRVWTGCHELRIRHSGLCGRSSWPYGSLKRADFLDKVHDYQLVKDPGLYGWLLSRLSVFLFSVAKVIQQRIATYITNCKKKKLEVNSRCVLRYYYIICPKCMRKSKATFEIYRSEGRDSDEGP
jgi:hypothetical protein